MIPHWLVTADESRRWEVRIRWTLDSRPAAEPAAGDVGRRDLVEVDRGRVTRLVDDDRRPSR